MQRRRGVDPQKRFSTGISPKSTMKTRAAQSSSMGSLVSRRLPEYSGPYNVGVREVEYAIPRVRIGRFKRKGSQDQVGVTLETVKFTAFYPCQSQDDTGSTWFPRFKSTIDGFLAMGGITSPILRYLASVWPIVHDVQFPACTNARLVREESKWPVVLFSHGAGSPALMYSHLCGELASSGRIVVAIEHRDGTSPGACVADEQGRERSVPWLRWTELD